MHHLEPGPSAVAIVAGDEPAEVASVVVPLLVHRRDRPLAPLVPNQHLAQVRIIRELGHGQQLHL